MTKLKEIAALVRSGLARDRDLEGLPRADILAIKSDCESGLHYKFAPGLVTGKTAVHTKKLSANDREVTHDASDETPDSQGDVVSVNGAMGGKGWQLDRFRKNAQLLWNHRSSEKPIGTVKSIRKTKGQDGQKALVSRSMFHEREMFGDDPWGAHVEAVTRLVKSGAMPGASVGFLPIAMHFPESEEERVALGLGRFGALITESELAELSITPVPSNKNALQHRSIRDEVLTGMIDEGWGDDRWRKEFVESFPLTLEELRDTNAAIRRRSITVPDLSGIAGDAASKADEESEATSVAVSAHASHTGGNDATNWTPTYTGNGIGGVWPNQPFWNLDFAPTPIMQIVPQTSPVDPEVKALLERVAETNELLTDALDDFREEFCRLRGKSTPTATRNGSPENFLAEVLEGAIEAVKSRQ